MCYILYKQEMVFFTECFITHITSKRMLSTNLCSDVFYQTAILTKCLITYFTSIWTLPTMYAGIFYKTALFTQCLIIHITSRRALTTMYVLMCYKTALFSECLFTHAYKGAHHSVHVDVL